MEEEEKEEQQQQDREEEKFELVEERHRLTARFEHSFSYSLSRLNKSSVFYFWNRFSFNVFISWTMTSFMLKRVKWLGTTCTAFIPYAWG